MVIFKSLLQHGNGKLLDFVNPETLESIKYAQFNTRAILDCPFRSKGCEKVCYATKGNHVFTSVKKSRIDSYADSKLPDFVERMVYTIGKVRNNKRYHDSIMLIRIHESGDFYSVQYLRNWVAIWKATMGMDNVRYTFYTKSFPFFLMLTDDEASVINHMMAIGKLSMNLSIDDTTSIEQKKAYLDCIKRYPKANTYYCTEDVDTVVHDNVCDCADCAKCGKCNSATGSKTVVKIHSASKKDMEEYRANIA